MDVVESLLALQRRLAEHERLVCGSEPKVLAAPGPRVEFSLAADGVDVTFWGEAYDDDPLAPADPTDEDSNYPFLAFLEWLARPAAAACVRSLRFTGPDEGANGLRAWQFARLVAAPVTFPRLHTFAVELTDPAAHNTSVVAGPTDEFCEDGTLGALLAKMPQLRVLQAPSAPTAAFFAGPLHPLTHLQLQSGLTHADFITNLAASDRFEALTTLDYAELCLADAADLDEAELAERYTAVTDFRRLLSSSAGRRLTRLVLRGTRLTAAEVHELGRARPDLQLLYVPPTMARYVSPQ
ncbi:hypothetical protein EII12_00815 [Buchananella hordeovulneris]|uniref:Uncharacterized protein n=1 Tax=Buchananella hordeovulneris TaxID=52770 RepID=A0A1Q5PYF7_9ACTO|nr:hypothetical protein [Buchananella hordeovulneris]OKL52479.1 hypothetical protein BSZ40_03205 [Buchananella hordeovulneris]RRD53911.1 hypothetical protein EII12_00815 [Buchananella hordeovulneris]